MVLPYQGLGRMVLVHTVMEPVTECLMPDGLILGFAGASVLVEVLVEAGAEVAAEADSVIGGRSELRSN
jgi:hypothetical protein